MKLLQSTRNRYISIDPETKELYFSGVLATYKLKYPFTIGDKTITSNEEGIRIYFKFMADAPTPSALKAMGRALFARLKK